MRLWLALLAVAACRADRAPAAPRTSGPAYRALFEPGRTWTLPIESVTGTKQGERFVAGATERGTLSCKIDDVHEVGDARVARLACAAPHAGLLVVGAWVAEPAGLYHPFFPPDDPDELATLGDDDLLLTAVPAERHHSHAIEASQDSVEAFASGGSWCVRDSTTAGLDRRDYTLCFDASGITGGGEVVITGPDETWRRVTFGKAPPDADDPTQAD